MKQQRRAGYWPGYHASRASEKDFVVGRVKYLVRKKPPLEPVRKSRRGRPRVYPHAEMAIVCVLMDHFNISSYEAENAAASWDLDGLVPDNTAILRAHAELDMQWLEDTVAETAKACLEKAEVGEASEATRRRTAPARRPTGTKTWESRTKRPAETVARAKSYPKLHIFAVLRLQIILSYEMTPGSVADTDMLPPLLEKAKKLGRSFAGWRLHADKEYDSDRNCKAVLDMGMRPNIEQRESRENSGNRRNVGKRFRRRVAALFDRWRYRKRGDGRVHIRGRGDARPPAALQVQEKRDAGEVRHAARGNV